MICFTIVSHSRSFSFWDAQVRFFLLKLFGLCSSVISSSYCVLLPFDNVVAWYLMLLQISLWLCLLHLVFFYMVYMYVTRFRISPLLFHAIVTTDCLVALYQYDDISCLSCSYFLNISSIISVCLLLLSSSFLNVCSAYIHIFLMCPVFLVNDLFSFCNLYSV